MMRTVPIDSSDARELREAEAEQEAAAAAAELQSRRDHAERCRGGWLGEDAAGRPRICPVCRPHLLRVDCRTCGASVTGCLRSTGVRRGRCCEFCDHEPRSTPTTTEGPDA